jgi:hypothetical protein
MGGMKELKKDSSKEGEKKDRIEEESLGRNGEGEEG